MSVPQGNLIKELEARVQQMSVDAEATARVQTQLQQEKTELQMSFERTQADLRETQAKYVKLLVIYQYCIDLSWFPPDVFSHFLAKDLQPLLPI